MIAALSFLALVLAAPPDPVLATYREGEVTRKELDTWLLAQGRRDEPDPLRPHLEAIALAETLEREALERGIEKRPREAFWIADAEREVLAAALRRATSASVQVTDAEVTAYLEAHRSDTVKPRRARLRNIYKRVPDGASPEERSEVRRRAEEIRRRLVAGEEFEALAETESDSQTALRGGLIGDVKEGTLDPAVEKAAFALAPGEISPVIEGPDGFTILRCEGVTPGRVMPDAEARSRIREGLLSRRVEAEWTRTREELLRKAEAVYLPVGDGPADQDPVVARSRLGTVLLSHLRTSSGDPSLDGSRPALVRRLAEEQVFRLAASREAVARGLDRDERVRASQLWKRRKILATAQMAELVNARLKKPTPEEVREYFASRRESFRQPASYDVSILRLPYRVATLRADFDRAERTLARVRSGETSFEEASRAHSDHSSASAGGRLGWRTAVELAWLGPRGFKALQALRDGETSGLVQEDDAFLVLKLWGRREPRPMTLEEAAPAALQRLGNERTAALQKEIEAALTSRLELRTTP